MRSVVAKRLSGIFRYSVTLAVLAGVPTMAWGAVHTVTNGNNSGPGSLRQVLADASPGDEVRFSEGSRSVTLAGELGLAKNVTIVGPGTITQTADKQGVLVVSGGVTGILRDLTLQGGRATHYGGGVHVQGNLVMERCLVQNNQSSYRGGGIALHGSGSRATLTDCTLSGNKAVLGAPAGSDGGGIFNELGTLVMTRCTLKNNYGHLSGGGITSLGPTTMTECVVESNTTVPGGQGGGIYASCSHPMILIGCTIRNNDTRSTNFLGGGIYKVGGSYTASFLSLKNGCVITDNKPDNVCATYVSDGTNTIGGKAGKSAIVLSGTAPGISPTPRKTVGEPDVSALSLDLTHPESAPARAIRTALIEDLGGLSSDVVAGMVALNASLYHAFAYEDLMLSDKTGNGTLSVEFTASWPDRVRYYALFARADGLGYEIPERGIAFEIRPGQPLPPGVTPPEFYVPGEGLMTWRNVVTDGGSFDLDPNPGAVTFRVSSIRAAATAPGRESGGGCDTGTGAGLAPFALLLAVPGFAFHRIPRIFRASHPKA